MLSLVFSDFRLIAQDVLAFALILAAFLWGGGPEKAVAAVWLIVFEVLGRLHKALFGADYLLLDVDPFLAAKDIVAGVLWLAIALYANRNWTLWVAGTQLLAVGAHIARALADAVSPVGYAVMIAAPGWIQLLLLGAGTVRHILRKREYGEYRQWRIGPGGRRIPVVARVHGWKRAVAEALPGRGGSGQ